MRTKKYIFLLLFSFTFLQLKSQHNYLIDSLKSVFKSSSKVYDRVNALNDICREYINAGEYYKAQQYGKAALQLSHLVSVSDDKAEEKRLLKQSEIRAFKNMGIINGSLSQFPTALDYFQKSLRISEEIDDKYSVASSFVNIGKIYNLIDDYAKALDYQKKALKMLHEIGDIHGIATCLNNIGDIYINIKDYTKALDYMEQSLKMREEIKDNYGITTCFCNIGSIYESQKNYSKSLEYYEDCLKKAKEINNQEDMVYAFSGIGSSYLELGDEKKAETYFNKILEISKKSGELNAKRLALVGLNKLFEKQGRYKDALVTYKQFINVRDSIINDEKNNAITRQEMKYEFGKKEAAQQAEQEKKDVIAKQQAARQSVIRNSLLAGFVLVIIFTVFIYRGYRNTKRANAIISLQKIIVEKKNKEVHDSITYAKHLQDAILPPLKFIEKHLPESFVLYLPKDIVAGDFYWMEISKGKIFLAAADCTGHGVPGAMVSVVCSNALNRTVKEFGITDPGKILDKVTELVLETFEKSESNVQDGMDISLLSLPLNGKNNSGGNMSVQWAGANNPLWIVRENDLLVYDADGQPIGKFENKKPFTTHSIELFSNDHVYLCTDGYADQFGGEKGKKFKTANLKKLLQDISSKPSFQQRSFILQTYEDWSGNLEQVDDVCVIGFRV